MGTFWLDLVVALGTSDLGQRGRDGTNDRRHPRLTFPSGCICYSFSHLFANYVRLRAEAQEDEKFLAGDESGAAVGRQCFGSQVSSVNLRTDGWISPLLHPIGVSVSNAVLAIAHCLWVAAHYSAFLSFSPCNSTVHLFFFLGNRTRRMTLLLLVSRRNHVRRAALPEYGQQFW